VKEVRSIHNTRRRTSERERKSEREKEEYIIQGAGPGMSAKVLLHLLTTFLEILCTNTVLYHLFNKRKRKKKKKKKRMKR
jgi:hypothetical protein